MSIYEVGQHKVNPRLDEKDAFETVFAIISVGFVLLVTFMLATGMFVRRESWMDTATMPMQNKIIASYHGDFVLAPKECVGPDLVLKSGCEDKIIKLPIQP